MTAPELTPATEQPAVGAQVERSVGRLEPERDIFDYEPGDEDWIGYDDTPQCPRCHGDGMDPWTDYALPCPECGGREC